MVGMDLSNLALAMTPPNEIGTIFLDLVRIILGGRVKFEYTPTQIVTAILYVFLICLLFASGAILIIVTYRNYTHLA
jgi:hypothetical protein